MLAWVNGAGLGMRADYRPCRKFEDAQSDLLLVPDDAAFEEIRRSLDLSTIKK
jgi:hypothetical protein